MVQDSSRNMPRDSLAIAPRCAPCYNFLKDNKEEIKTTWIIPTRIRLDDGYCRIVWNCNWGHICEAGCFFAFGKKAH